MRRDGREPYLLPDGLVRPLLRGWLHLGAFVVAVVACGVLVIAADSDAAAAIVVYGLGVCGLFGVSSLYHRGRWRADVRARLQRLDHAMIFVLIAGTYTPVCALVLDEPLGTILLIVVWSGALVGASLQLLPRPTPRALGVGLYLALGWVVVVAMPAVVDELGWGATALIALGGAFYTAGAVIYGLKRPDPAPAIFGYHEVFHALTIAAAAAHYVVIAGWVLPFEG